MKIEWLISDIIAVRSPDRVERAILKLILADHYFLPIQAVFVVDESICDVGAQSWALTTLLRVIFNENKAVGHRCNSCRITWQSRTCYFGGDCGWACFWPIQASFVAREPLCDVGTPLELEKLYLGSFNEKTMVGCQCNSCRIPWQSRMCYFESDFGFAIFRPNQDIFVVGEPLCDVGTPLELE